MSYYEEPDGSKWVVAVDYRGKLSLIKPPDVWEGYYEDWGYDPSIPDDTEEVGPGVYRVTATMAETTPWEAGLEGVWHYFEWRDWEPLWQLEEGTDGE